MVLIIHFMPILTLTLLILFSTKPTDANEGNIQDFLNFQMIYNGIGGFCYLSEAVVTNSSLYLPLVDSISDKQLEDINKQWNSYAAYAADYLQRYDFLTHDVVSDWIKTLTISTPSNISLSSWTHFLQTTTECFASYYEAHKIVTSFVESTILVSFTTRSRYPPHASFIDGETYFMNTAARGNNAHGHFAMKALEFFGLAASPSLKGTTPIKLNNFKNIIFQDFPFLPQSNRSSWVSIVWEIITRSYAHKERPPFCYNHFNFANGTAVSFRECIMRDKNEYSNLTSFTDATNTLVFRDMYFSGNYQRPFPLPNSAELWRKTLYKSDFALSNNLFVSDDLPKIYDNQITILKRSDGTSTRGVDNVDVLIRVINDKFPTYKVNTVEISASMPVHKQAELFHSSTILITSHGSQLWNIIFSRPDTYIIELQPVWYSREFKIYGQHLLVNAFIQFYGNRYNGGGNKYHHNYGSWPTLNTGLIHRNFLVETHDFMEILDDIKMRMKQSHIHKNRGAMIQ